MKKADLNHSIFRKVYMKRLLSCAFCLLGWLTLVHPSKADSPWRIPNYASYVELNDGTVFCGEMYDSWHEGRTGNVCAGGQYDSWHEGRTGEVACGADSTTVGTKGELEMCVLEGSTPVGMKAARARWLAAENTPAGTRGAQAMFVLVDSTLVGMKAARARWLAAGDIPATTRVKKEKVCFGGLYRSPSLNDLSVGPPRPEPTVRSNSTSQTAKLMIFGGENHKTYLGCLTCSEYETDSVRNNFGDNGSPYSSSSIWNHYSEYGSARVNDFETGAHGI
jgi:hypothetical protein